MPEAQPAQDGRPRVLLALNTGHRYAMHYFEALIDMGCAPQVTTYKGNEIEFMQGRHFEVLVHMGLGPDDNYVLGLELVAHANKLFPGVPILVLSGHDNENVLKDVLRKGGADFLHRPDRKAEGDVPTEADIIEFQEKVRHLLPITGAKIE